MASLALANPVALICAATIRQQPQHFQVDEILPFTPSGDGGHAFLRIEKTGVNTEWLARQLAAFAEVKQVDIGYAGLKDRHAVTTQWFSVKIEGKTEPDWSAFDVEGCRIIEQTYHNKKLRTGSLKGNRFTLVLTQVIGSREVLETSLTRIKQRGVPNYFGEQRFGREYHNLEMAQAWFEDNQKPKKRHIKSLVLSAARSWLFNQVLSKRIDGKSWNQYVEGDVMQLAGSHSVFNASPEDDTLESRMAKGDIHPTGPLLGRGELSSSSVIKQIEQRVIDDWSVWCKGLEKAGLEQARRALRVIPEEMSWSFEDANINLSFTLPSGSFATCVLRELAVISDATKGTISHHTVSES
jgi:tRNA pseudouridine13 synthase